MAATAEAVNREGGPATACRDSRSERARPAAEPPLGIYAKSRSALRAERFALQATARVLLGGERVTHCMRTRRRDHGVSVWRSVEQGHAHFKGLQTCASVWHCPVCAARISERRRAELEAAIAVHRARGGDVVLVTVTNSHHRGDRLADLLAGQEKALHRFRSARASRAIWEAAGVVGMIRALEVTHGRNGWHPHYHFLVFVHQGASADQGGGGRSPTAPARPERALAFLREVLSARWRECCQAAGLPLPDLAHGVDVRGGQWAARYASKWGLEQEMTKAHLKRGKGGGRTPFDLLREAFETGEVEPCQRFQEYARHFKGKRQLVWSPGLKALLGVGEITDQELADHVDEESEFLGRITVLEWKRILKWDLRAHVLEAAERGWEAVRELLGWCLMADREEKQDG